VNGLGPGIDVGVGVGEETSSQGVDMVHQHMQGGVMPNGMGQVQRLVPGQVTHHMMRHEEEESAEEAVMGSLALRQNTTMRTAVSRGQMALLAPVHRV